MIAVGQYHTKHFVLNQLHWANQNHQAYMPSQEELEAIWPASTGGLDAERMLQDIEQFAALITA